MFDQYHINGVFDEMFNDRGSPRRHYSGLNRRLVRLGSGAFERRRRMADVSFRNQGITCTVYADQGGVERIFPYDLVPRNVPADEWDDIARELTQRITAQNLFCQHVYHEQRILRERHIPPEQVFGAKKYRR